jgi:hypothetical protein
MQEFLADNGTALVVFGFILLALVVALAPLIVYVVQWRRVRQAEIEAALYRAELETSLKKDMLNRGMSAEEIHKVLHGPTNQPSNLSDFRALLAEFFNPAQTAAEGEGEKGWEALGKHWKEFGKGWKKFGKMWGKGCGWRQECRS